jgi:ribosomal protein L40E
MLQVMTNKQYKPGLQEFTRCRGCGAVNDADATDCYLCGRTGLLHACPNCSAPFRNPFDLRCRSCNTAFMRPDAEG